MAKDLEATIIGPIEPTHLLCRSLKLDVLDIVILKKNMKLNENHEILTNNEG